MYQIFYIGFKVVPIQVRGAKAYTIRVHGPLNPEPYYRTLIVTLIGTLKGALNGSLFVYERFP